MKALALPGLGLNGNIMRLQMGPLHDLISAFLTIEYLDPPYECSPDILPAELVPQIAREQIVYRWGDTYLNMQSDVDRILKMIESDPKIICLIGFSQGCSVATLIAQKTKQLCCVILFSCSGMLQDKNTHNHLKIMDLPSFITLGTRDMLQMNTWVETNQFINPKVIVNEFSHRIPKLNAFETRQLKQFLINTLGKPKL